MTSDQAIFCIRNGVSPTSGDPLDFILKFEHEGIDKYYYTKDGIDVFTTAPLAGV